VYTPPFNVVSDEAEIRAMVDAASVAWLVTVDDAGRPLATSLPIMWTGETVVAHIARANPHWQQIPPDSPALLIVSGPDGYISPSWYAAKAEHGKVVPTWNYTAVHLAGTVRVHEDAEWLRDAVTRLTDVHETGRDERWRVTDAPASYIDGQLRGIVGLEITITRVEGKAKLSQNRSEADQRGVIDGLQSEPNSGSKEIAEAMKGIRR
jgi:transcriptional regulator